METNTRIIHAMYCMSYLSIDLHNKYAGTWQSQLKDEQKYNIIFFNYVVPFVFYFIVMRTLFLFSAYLVFHIQIVTQVLMRNFVMYLNIKFKCTTVKSSFATEDDMRMSKHV